MEAVPVVRKWMARLYEMEGTELPRPKENPILPNCKTNYEAVHQGISKSDVSHKAIIDRSAGQQALIKAYNGALKKSVLLAVAEEYQSLWGCEQLWVVPSQRDKERLQGRDTPAFTQQELFVVIDAVMANEDGAHALIRGYKMARGGLKK
ncbi:hypothetical protein [Anaeroarcus burkinensis]|uniref:hypothetical protein n=1 Tax=Anaeroarcus burkinensis TaxID=82376 RepID=UPI0004186D1D|nr:hypothetical protein [Anaeroarcus burkinensis]